MPSDGRKIIEVRPDYYDWARDHVTRTIKNADKILAAGRPLNSQKDYLLYKKILRAMEQHNDKLLRLARKEAKILWRDTNKVVDYLTDLVIPEYNRRIIADPLTSAKYLPYIEKTQKVKAMLVLGIADLRKYL